MFVELEGYRNLTTLTGVTHKTSMNFGKVFRVFLLYQTFSRALGLIKIL